MDILKINIFIMSILFLGCDTNIKQNYESNLSLDIENSKDKNISMGINKSMDYSIPCEEIDLLYISKSELKKMTVKAENGDVRLAYILHRYFLDLENKQNQYNNINKKSNYWLKKCAYYGNIECTIKLLDIVNNLDVIRKIKILKEEEIFELKKDYSLERFTKNYLETLIEKAIKGDYVSSYLLTTYYYANQESQQKNYLFWLEKLANSKDNYNIVSKINFLYEISNESFKNKMAKKWHLEFLIKPKIIVKRLTYSESDNLKHRKQIEYRDDDPKGVFFDENGSVIKYE